MSVSSRRMNPHANRMIPLTLGTGLGKHQADKRSLTVILFAILCIICFQPAAAQSGQHLSFRTSPQPTLRSGDKIDTIQVAILDSTNAVVDQTGTVVSLSLYEGNGNTLSGTVSSPTSHGIATFSNLYVAGCPRHMRLNGTAPAITSSQSHPFSLAASVVYVSTSGNDLHCGNTATTAFGTISYAALVTGPAENGSPATTVYIAGGTYRESGPIVPASSGDASSPVTFTHTPGDPNPVIIDGADPVMGWVAASSTDGLDSSVSGVYKASVNLYSRVDGSHDPYDYSQQIFIDGRMLPEARYPHNTLHGTAWVLQPAHIAMNVTGITADDANTIDTVQFKAMPQTHLTDALTGGALSPNLARPADYWRGALVHYSTGSAVYDSSKKQVNYAAYWNGNSGHVTGSTADGTLTMQIPQNPNQNNGTADNPTCNVTHDPTRDVSSGSPFYITGVLGELRNSDEWEISNGSLFFKPSTGSNPDTANHLVEIKHRPYAFDLSGHSYITISNIGLFATSVFTDANSNNIVIDSVHAMYVSHFDDFKYYKQSPNPSIIRSDLSNPPDANAAWFPGWVDTGLVLAGDNSKVQNSTIEFSAGNGILITGKYGSVTNNVIHDVNYSLCNCSGVDTGYQTTHADGLSVTNNTIYNAGISLIKSYGIYTGDFEHNELWGGAQRTRDQGAFYTNQNKLIYPTGQGSRVAYNIIHDMIGVVPGAVYAGIDQPGSPCLSSNYNNTPSPCDVGNDPKGIYLDDGTTLWTVSHNLLFDTGWGIYNNVGTHYTSDSNGCGVTKPIGTALFAYNNTVFNNGGAIGEHALGYNYNPFYEVEYDPSNNNSAIGPDPYTGGTAESKIYNNLFQNWAYNKYNLGSPLVHTGDFLNTPAAVDNTWVAGPLVDSNGNFLADGKVTASSFKLDTSAQGQQQHKTVGAGVCVPSETTSAGSCGPSETADLGAFPSSSSAYNYNWTAGSPLCHKDSTGLACTITPITPTR